MNESSDTGGSDLTPTGDDELLKIFVGPKNPHYFTHAFKEFAADGRAIWNWPVLFFTLPWLLYRKMWLYSLSYLIGVPIVLIIIARVAALAIGSGADVSIYYVPYFVVGFILAPMFATRLYYGHARKKIRDIKVRTPSVDEQRLEVARAGSTSVFGGFAAAFLSLIGILAALAIPGYSDYTVRAQVSEGLNLSGAAKASVSEYYLDHNQFPSDNVSAGLSPATDIQGKYVSSVQIDTGEIVVTFGNDADSDIHGETLVLRPELSDQGIYWVCFSRNIAMRDLPAVCR